MYGIIIQNEAGQIKPDELIHVLTEVELDQAELNLLT